jgi:DNA replication protein DnaC
MKDFSETHPNLQTVLREGDLLYFGEEHLQAAEERLQNCIQCKQGEKCSLTDHNPGYSVDDAGRVPIGVQSDGCIEYGECEKWVNLKRAKRLKKIGIPPLFHNSSFENFKPQNEKAKAALKGCQKFVEDILNQENPGGIFLNGPFGTGKTHLAAASMAALSDSGCSNLLFAVVPKLLALTRKAINTDDPRDYVGEASEANVLVLDDVGAEKISEWAREQLFLIINSRYENQLPTILTTNASMAELEQRIGGAAVSRICQMAQGYVLNGSDFRRKGA